MQTDTGSYITRYEGGNERVAASTFRLGLPQELELRDSLTMHPLEDMH